VGRALAAGVEGRPKRSPAEARRIGRNKCEFLFMILRATGILQRKREIMLSGSLSW
jgi:hypothetical protein